MNKALRYALAVVLAGLGLLLGAQQATAAADGPIKLEVAGDGARSVNVLVTWKKDGTPVTDVLAATLFAESPDGRTFGPVALMSAPEGQNLYNPAEPLPDGKWKVTVKATKPSKAQASTTLTSGEVANVPTTAPLTTAKMAERAVATEESASEGLPLAQIGIVGIAVVAAVVLFFVLVRSRRSSGV
ncbi:hypothetical protein [Herbidospora mongoliensis]|uniref:hypothetical protein n=1 Tax=Herbidospora mongoliensis TaxID=688067 RepID=UPI0008311798|nr:hypothetical protein [Herbidospora mongoliensis]